MELEFGVSGEATGILPTWRWEDATLAKKARAADLSRPCQKGPMPATHITGIPSARDATPDPVVRCGTPQSRLRPGATGNLPVPTASVVRGQQPHWEVSPDGPPPQAPQPLQAAGRLIQSSPQNHFPGQPFQSPNACLTGKPHFLTPRTPNSSCATPSRTISGLFPRGPFRPRAPASSVESPVSTLKGPRPSPVPQAALQTPIVTNHLVRLVTAANRTPQQSTCTSTRAKTRRFPGPAGLLPHQVSDSFSLARAGAPQAAGGPGEQQSPRGSSRPPGRGGRKCREGAFPKLWRKSEEVGRIECLKTHM